MKTEDMRSPKSVQRLAMQRGRRGLSLLSEIQGWELQRHDYKSEEESPEKREHCVSVRGGAVPWYLGFCQVFSTVSCLDRFLLFQVFKYQNVLPKVNGNMISVAKSMLYTKKN